MRVENDSSGAKVFRLSEEERNNREARKRLAQEKKESEGKLYKAIRYLASLHGPSVEQEIAKILGDTKK